MKKQTSSENRTARGRLRAEPAKRAIASMGKALRIATQHGLKVAAHHGSIFELVSMDAIVPDGCHFTWLIAEDDAEDFGANVMFFGLPCVIIGRDRPGAWSVTMDEEVDDPALAAFCRTFFGPAPYGQKSLSPTQAWRSFAGAAAVFARLRDGTPFTEALVQEAAAALDAEDGDPLPPEDQEHAWNFLTDTALSLPYWLEIGQADAGNGAIGMAAELGDTARTRLAWHYRFRALDGRWGSEIALERDMASGRERIGIRFRPGNRSAILFGEDLAPGPHPLAERLGLPRDGAVRSERAVAPGKLRKMIGQLIDEIPEKPPKAADRNTPALSPDAPDGAFSLPLEG